MLFTREISQDSCLDGREVADDEFHARTGNKSSPDQLGQNVRNGIIEKIKRVIVTVFHEGSCLRQIRHVVLRKVL